MVKEFNIRNFGAIGDGVSNDTAALQNAIDACFEQGDGRVLVPAGVYLICPIRLRSNVNLHLARNAVLLASSNPLDYVNWRSDSLKMKLAPYNGKYLIGAENESNLSITGEGTIDGQSDAHYDRSNPAADWWPIFDKTTRPGRMIFIASCQNIRFEGVSFINAPAWTFWVLACEIVRFHNVTISTDLKAINTDGIDIDSCREVTITHCNITTGDDAIVLRAIERMLKEEKACEQVLVENCNLISRCNAIRIAYLRDGTIRNATMNNLTITGSRRGIICQVPSPLETPEKNAHIPIAPGPRIENLVFSNITIEAIQPIWIYLSNDGCAQRIGNLRFENITAAGSAPSVLKGNENTKVDNIVFRNGRLKLTTGAPRFSGSQGVEELATALALSDCENVSLNNLIMEGANLEACHNTPALGMQRTTGLDLNGIQNRTLHPAAPFA